MVRQTAHLEQVALRGDEGVWTVSVHRTRVRPRLPIDHYVAPGRHREGNPRTSMEEGSLRFQSALQLPIAVEGARGLDGGAQEFEIGATQSAPSGSVAGSERGRALRLGRSVTTA